MPWPWGNRSKKEKLRTKSFDEQKEQQHASAAGGYQLIKPEDLVVVQKLGNGRYEAVEQGEWYCSGDKKVVTIKTVPRKIQGEFLLDVNRMMSLQHPHIITFYGISLPDAQLDIPLRLVTEYANLGSLLENLKRGNPDICSVLSFFCYAVQIALGMEYLANKKFVHQDLATHNILVFETRKVKISDFGLARHLESTDSLDGTGMPISCCAPEVARRHQYSTAGDVWSYGVLLWEMFSFGDSSWENLTHTEKEDVGSETLSERLLCPRACPEEIYSTMLQCWQLEPSARPTFTELLSRLDKIKLAQMKATTGCEAGDPHYLSYKANDKITVLSSTRDDSNLWFGELQGVGSLGLFDPKHMKGIEDGVSRNITEVSTISRPFNLRVTEKSDLFRQLNIDENSIPKPKGTPKRSFPTSDPAYVDMNQGHASGSPFEPKVDDLAPTYVSMTIYEDVHREETKPFLPERQGFGSDYYQAPLVVLREIKTSDARETGEEQSNQSENAALFPERSVFIPERSVGKKSSITEKANGKGDSDLFDVHVETPSPKPEGGFSTVPRREKQFRTPPPLPERTDLLEKEKEIRQRSQSESTQRRKDDNTAVKKRPVPTPRRRRPVSEPSNRALTEEAQGSAVKKVSFEVSKQAPVGRSEFPENHISPDSQLAHVLFDNSVKDSECDLNLKGEMSDGSLKKSAKNVFMEPEEARLAEARKEGRMPNFKLSECPDGEAEQQLSKPRLSPDGSESPDAGQSITKLASEGAQLPENCDELLKPTAVGQNIQCDDKQVFSGNLAGYELIDLHQPEQKDETPPLLPPKDIMSRLPQVSESHLPEPLLPSPPPKDSYLQGTPGYLPIASKDQLGSPAMGRVWGDSVQSETSTIPVVSSGIQPSRGQMLDGVGGRSPNTRPLPPVPGSPLTPGEVDAQFGKHWQFGNATCSSPIPIQAAVTQSQIIGDRSTTPNTRPLPPVPGSPLTPTSASFPFMQRNWQCPPSSVPVTLPLYEASRFGPTVTSPTAFTLQSEEESLEQPIYDFLLPPVPLPPEIPTHILNQPPPAHLPFDTNTAYAYAQTEKVVGSDLENSLTDNNTNITSGKDSSTSVLSRKELEGRYGRDAEAVEQIHREFPYEYDTCHSWLVAYQGDQQAVLRYFKVNLLVSFTCKSEAECQRALDLYKMDVQRAANHLITQGN